MPPSVLPKGNSTAQVSCSMGRRESRKLDLEEGKRKLDLEEGKSKDAALRCGGGSSVAQPIACSMGRQQVKRGGAGRGEVKCGLKNKRRLVARKSDSCRAALESASLQSESQTPTRGQTNATRKQAKGGRRKDRKEERQREFSLRRSKGEEKGEHRRKKGKKE